MDRNGQKSVTGLSVMMLAAAAVLAGPIYAWAGSLEPSNAPAPTMHTLEEIYERLLAVERRVQTGTPSEAGDGMVLVPAGSFVQGNNFSGEGDIYERPCHTVTVSAFYISQYEITKGQWDDVYSWALTNGYGFSNAGAGKEISHPVQMVNWYDCVRWANARSEKEGLTPCYYTSSATTTVYRNGELGITNACVRWDADGYRLPTESEWEKAARGGATGRRFPWADANTIRHERANFNAVTSFYYDVSATNGYHPDFDYGSMPYTSPVGSFAPNGYGIFDMAGNVWEWCWDALDASYYATSPDTDPHGPDINFNRILRGGSCLNPSSSCRVAIRAVVTPSDEYDYVGFRVVRAAQ